QSGNKRKRRKWVTAGSCMPVSTAAALSVFFPAHQDRIFLRCLVITLSQPVLHEAQLFVKPDRALVALAHLQVPDPDPCFFRLTDQAFHQHLPNASFSAVLPDAYIGNLPLIQAQDDPAVSQDLSIFLRG